MSRRTPTGSQSGFSFGKILTPKSFRKTINFNEQPSQNDTPNLKKPALEAYARKNKPTLPPNFSDLVLECEMELEKEEISMSAINLLADLYTQAISYYESEGSDKYKYFAKKLQDLMFRPNVKEAMMKEAAPAQSAEEDKELRRMRLESQVSKVNTEREAFTLVKSHENKEKEIKRVLEGDLESQKDRIRRKLAERKARASSRAQSVTYISDETSSTEEKMQDLERELEGSPKASENNLIKIEEVDESRYATPPRRRNKDGLVVFQNQKGRKNLMKFFLEEFKEEPTEKSAQAIKTKARRYSDSKGLALTLAPLTLNKGRVSRAKSFTSKDIVPVMRKDSGLSNDEKDTKSEDDVRELKGKSEISGEGVNEGKEEEKPKSNNTVEETDDEGSRNDVNEKESKEADEEKIVEDKKIEACEEGVEEVEVNKESVKLEESCVQEVVEEKRSEENEEKESIVKEVQEEEVQLKEDVAQESEKIVVEIKEEKEEEVIVEQEAVEVREEKEEAITVVKNEMPHGEEVEVSKGEQEIAEAKPEEEERTVQIEENRQEECAIEEKVEHVEEVCNKEVEKKEEIEAVEEVQEAVVQIEAKVEEKNDIEGEVVQQEECLDENKAEELGEDTLNKEENQEKCEEQQQQEICETHHVEKEEAQVNRQEEKEVAVEEIKEQKQEEVEKEETAKSIRRRTDSELADEQRIIALRRIEEEHKKLLEEFIAKQARDREEAARGIEEKYEKKIKTMEDDMEEEEKTSMMWQKAVAKINKDKETELQKLMEKLCEEHAQEAEKYKKKLQQQKVFKLAQISS